MPVFVVGFYYLLSSVSTCEYRTTDVGIVADTQFGIFCLRHVATSIYIVIEGSAFDADGRFSEEVSHVGKNFWCIFCIFWIIFCSIRHTISTAEDRAEEGSASDIECYVSIGLTQFLVIAVIGSTIFVFMEEIVRSTTAAKDTLLAIEGTAIDGK